MKTLTQTKVVALGQIVSLQLVFGDIQVQPTAHVEWVTRAGVGVSHFCREQMHWLVAGSVQAVTCTQGKAQFL